MKFFRKKAVAAVGDANADVLGRYPAEMDVPALEGRRYLWTARAFAIGMYFSLLVNVALGFALYGLTPLKSITPMLVTFSDKREQVVRIEPFETTTRGYSLMTQKLAAEYVKYREEIVADAGEQQRRWAEYMGARMTPQAFQQFRLAMAGPYKEYQEQGRIRTVDILDVRPLSNNYFQIEFKATDFDANNQPIGETLFEAGVSVAYVARQVRDAEKFVNPLGFTVTKYTRTARTSNVQQP